MLQNSQGNTCVWVSYLVKLQSQTYNFIKKETPRQVFSCEFYEILWNTFFYRTPLVSASENIKKEKLKRYHKFLFLIFNFHLLVKSWSKLLVNELIKYPGRTLLKIYHKSWTICFIIVTRNGKIIWKHRPST